MHSKRRYKIFVCSVILGELESFRNYKGFSIIFPQILDAIQRITKVRIFLIPLSITYLNPKISAFRFLTKNSLTSCSQNQGQIVGARESLNRRKIWHKRKVKSSSRRLLFFLPYFSACLDFPSPPLSAPGSPRMA